MPKFFFDHQKRNLILWLTDMTVAIASYFYVTRPEYIEKILDGMDFATLRPDIDPLIFQLPEFREYMHKTIVLVTVLTIVVIALFHTWAFYKCYLRKRSAIAYVKIYSFLAAFSLGLWFIYNFHYKNIFILIPTAIYSCVFLAEKQTQVTSVKSTQ